MLSKDFFVQLEAGSSCMFLNILFSFLKIIWSGQACVFLKSLWKSLWSVALCTLDSSISPWSCVFLNEITYETDALPTALRRHLQWDNLWWQWDMNPSGPVHTSHEGTAWAELGPHEKPTLTWQKKRRWQLLPCKRMEIIYHMWWCRNSEIWFWTLLLNAQGFG